MTPRTASVLAAAAMLLAVGGLIASRALVAAGTWALAFQGAAVLLALWARVTFGVRSGHMAADPTAGGLVTTGPYRYVRHPIYAAVLLVVWTGGATHAVPATLALAALATAAVGVRIRAEERLVAARYSAYAAYAARTARLVPGVF